MSEFLIITAPGASLGFRCAGVECFEAGDGVDVPSFLFKLQAEGRYGLVAVEEKILKRVSDNEMRRINKRGLPIIIPINIPEKWGEVEFGESPVVRLIRRAIGYQIKIRK